MVPATASAHEWDSEYWLERLVRNHTKVIDCMLLVQDNDIATFRAECSTHTMAYQQNVIMDELEIAGMAHKNDIEGFVLEHFDEIQMPVVQQNLRIYTAIEGIIVSHFIVEGLTRNYTAVNIPEGTSSTVDEPPGN